MINFIKNMKKIELHIHLDGSVRISTISDILNMNLSDVKKMTQVDNDCNYLKEYLAKFELPLKIMQTKENLERISYELAEDLEKDNVIYAEIRFAPQFHANSLTYDEIIDSVLNGLKKGKIRTNLILCCMRGENTYESNLKTIDIAFKYLNKGVCAIDLAGDEYNYPNQLYEYIFDKCKQLNIPYTIHSGEALGKDSIYKAISYKTKRIGHGINYENDIYLINLLKQNNITLEICPTSNLNTKVVDEIKNHPLYELYKNDVLITINTDNRTVSNTTLYNEYELLYNTFKFTKKDFIKFNINSIEASFLNEEEKKEIRNFCENEE
ncbi:MAG: adenosine deaminase [Bacilli bacterium]|nr:adenosine deaminase [Bacilli bacterium]